MRNGSDSSAASRSTGVAAVTTVVALMAMAAAVPRAPALVVMRAATEVALARSEPGTRIVAVVVAAARDLLTGGQAAVAIPALPTSVALGAPQVLHPCIAEPLPGVTDLLDERVLDLPPPRC